MPTLLTRKMEASKDTTPCDFESAALNVMEAQQISQEELRLRCSRFKTYLASLQPPQDQVIIRAANFTTDSVLQLIQQSPGSSFIRVYYGIDASGEHLMFMAPVQATTTSSTLSTSSSDGTTSTEDPLYVDDCCHCPPMGNCPNDPILEEQP